MGIAGSRSASSAGPGLPSGLPAPAAPRCSSAARRSFAPTPASSLAAAASLLRAVIVRSQSQLSEFIPPPAGESDVPDIVKVRDRLTTLDAIDFVFIDGDDNLLPWTRPAAAMRRSASRRLFSISMRRRAS